MTKLMHMNPEKIEKVTKLTRSYRELSEDREALLNRQVNNATLYLRGTPNEHSKTIYLGSGEARMSAELAIELRAAAFKATEKAMEEIRKQGEALGVEIGA